MTETALSVQNLTKIYKGGNEALKGVSLEIPQGDFFALLGPNGAGKTTLIGIITGIVNKTEGIVRVFGADIDTHPEKARTYIGVVPQELNFNIFEKVIDIVVNQAGYYGISRSVAIPRAEKILADVGLYDQRYHKSMTLSGGMKRRLMIARALIHEPRFLVLDEPTAGVDVELRRGMWDYLKTLTGQGITILLTTHYLEEAEQLAKNIAIINKGNIIAEGTLKEILSKLQTEVVVLDLAVPITQSALTALANYKAEKIDDTTVEIEIGNGRGISDVVLILNNHDIPVQTMRGKSGRLEEIFMRLTTADNL